MPGISVHVIDVANGVPARGMRVEMYEIRPDGSRRKVGEGTVGENGSFDHPMTHGEGITAGTYEAELHVGGYYRARSPSDAAPAFLDTVPFRFMVMDAGAHYHLPFKVSPWGLSVWRGR